MTCNNIILSQPESDAVLTHNIPDDVSARLNFGPQDISGLRLGDAGELIISFVEGGQLKITNFEDLIDNGNLLYLEDGTLIDPSILTSALQVPQDFNAIETASGIAANGDAIKIAQPAANTTQEVSLQAGQKYVCDFDPTHAAHVEIVDGQMVLTFTDGSRVVIDNYSEAMAGDLPAEMTVADGTVIDGEELLTTVTEIEAPVEEILELAEVPREPELQAEQVANIEPAAGENLDSVAEALAQVEPAAGDGAIGNTGYGFGSTPSSDPLNSPYAIGPIGATALAYNAPGVNPERSFLRNDPRPGFDVDPAALDETNLAAGDLVATGNVHVNYGGDGPGTIAPNGSFSASCNLTGGSLSSHGVPVIVTQTADGYVGMAGTVPVFEFVIDNAGEYTYTQHEPFDHSDTTDANENICLDFGIVATDSDGDATSTNVRITVADDAPVLACECSAVVDETNDVGGVITTTGHFSTDPSVDVDETFAGTDTFHATGSVAGGVLTSNGVPVTVTFDAVTNAYTGMAGGELVFTLALNPDTGVFVYNQMGPLDHADATDPNDELVLHFGASVTDYDGDTVTGEMRVRVLDDAPSLVGAHEALDETSAFPGSVNGTVVADFGWDQPGTLTGTGSGSFTATGSLADGSLTSNGVPVTVTFDAATNTYTGTAGGSSVFTLVLDPATGDYVFTLQGPLDHADGIDPNDVITLGFGVTATDYDGDTATTSITIDVLDDVPEISSAEHSLDETDLSGGSLVATGTITHDFGEDGAGEISGTDSFGASASGSSLTLTSHGHVVVVSFDAATNTYTGVANGATIFTLEIDASTGEYTYTQLDVVDHPDGSDPDDVVALSFGIGIEDYDGDTDTDTDYIVINLHDDGPSLAPVLGGVADETDLGPVVLNGDVSDAAFGEDGPAATDAYSPTGDFASSGSQLGGSLTHHGTPVTVTFDAATDTYTGMAGTTEIFTMVISEDGTYTFTLVNTLDHADPNDPNDIINLDFGVEVVDFDGDSATSYVRIQVKDDVPTIGDSSGDVDETNFDNGPLVYTDTVEFDFGSVQPNGDINSSAPLKACDGTPVTIVQTGDTYTGVANGVTIFTMVINPTTGQYTYTQFEPLFHPDGSDPDDVISIDFGIEVEADDGSTSDAVITINVADDGPEATNDINGGEEGQFITGDVVANDDTGQENGHAVTNVTFNGTDHAVPVGGSVTIVGDYGTLVMNSDGTYDYTTNSNDPDGTDIFTYTLSDCDGDTDTATLTITVTPDGQPIAVSQSIAVDETNLTPGPMIFHGDLDVDFGIDGGGTVTGNGDVTVGGSLLAGALTSGGVPVVISFDAATNTYTGMAGTEKVFDVVINADGTYDFELFEPIDHADNTDPNDIITLNFGVTAADNDGDEVDGTFTIHIHDDAPVAYDDPTTTLDEGETVTGNVTNNDEFGEDDPNHVVEVIFNGTTTTVPLTGTTSVVGQYGTLTISSDGSYSYQANNSNPDGTDTFTYVLEDYDGDQDTAEISFNVNPINDEPVITPPPVETVDDTNLSSGPNVETGTISVNYGNDTPGSVDPNGVFSSSEATLSSCGHPINVTLSGNTYTGVANGVTIFTMEISENGDYTFTQFEQIAHPDTSDHNDVVTLNFGATATDSDGDEATTTLQVRVLDDGPEISEIVSEVDESNFSGGTLTTNGTVPHDFGEDSNGEITPTGLFEAEYTLGGANVTLTSGGAAIAVTATGNTYTGVAAGVTIFTLTIDPATGEYVYTQFEPVDHPDATDPNDIVWLKFHVEITDCDGDTDTGIIIIDICDDGPVARDDIATAQEGETTTGNVITSNDDTSADEPNVVTQVVFNGTTTTVPATGTVNVAGQHGTLTIASNGSYSYVANNNTSGGRDVFTYTLCDDDGDADTANLSINVTPDYNPTNISAVGATDDTNVDGSASDVETGTINVNYHGDGPGTTTGNGAFSSNGNQTGGTLTHNGTAVNVSFNAGTNTYTGTAGGLTIFNMTINANGTYRFVQYESLDHSLTNSHNEALFLRFGITATDSDGDTGTGTAVITVRDDGPRAVNDSRGSTTRSASINVLSNDDAGADDGDVDVISFVYGGTTYNISGASRTINLGNGSSFRLDQDGDAYFTARNNTSSGSGNSSQTTQHTDSVTVTYTMRDADGDVSTATLVLSGRYSHTRSWQVDVGGDGGDGGDGTPLVLDLDGDGIELLSKEDGVLFDIDLDGVADQTAWAASDDGLLALDRNGDGVINDRSELFGDTDGFSDGFANLASYDSNGDGVIDANDEIYDSLVVWQDLNSDGVSDEGEMLTLAQLNIVSISLNSTPGDMHVEGNWISHVGTYLTGDGETHEIVDAWFQYDGSEGFISASDEADNFIFQAIHDSAVEIRDFDVTEDSVDLSALIEGQDDIGDAINEFVFVSEEDGATIISVDVDGAAGPAEAVAVAKLDSVTDTNLEDLIDNGNIII